MPRLELRHDTAADWTAANPVLAAGELAIETDTGLLKFGDGTTPWSGLSYLASPGSGVASVNGQTGAVNLDGTYARRANNLSDLANKTTARTNLGLGDAATSTLASIEAYSDARAITTSAGTKTADFTAAAGTMYKADASGGAIAATLPSGSIGGNLIMVQKIDSSSNIVTVGGAVVAGTIKLRRQWESALFMWGGASWFHIGAADPVTVGTATMVTPEQFGAVGDGTTDDSAAIQAAIDYVAGLTYAGTVWFSRVYAHATRLSITNDNVHLAGMGMGSVLKWIGGADWMLRIGFPSGGTSINSMGLERLNFMGNASSKGGVQAIAMKFSRWDSLRFSGFSDPAAWPMQLTTQSDGTFQASSNNFLLVPFVQFCANGLQFTKDPADTGTDGSNFNSVLGGKFGGTGKTGGTGIDNDAGEFNNFFGCDSSSWGTGVRINDDVCCFFGIRTDGSGTGIHITTNGRDHYIANPTGNGTDNWIVRDNADTPGVIVRRGWTGNAHVGEVIRTTAAAGTYTSPTLRTWANVGTTAFSQGQIGFINSGFGKGGLKRCDTAAGRRRLFVAYEAVAIGASGRFHEKGSVGSVLCDTAAVVEGDTLVQSTATAGSATVNNTVTDPALIVGFAREPKAAGTAALVEAYFT